MSFNIMDMVKGQISDQLVGQIGGLLGESPDKTRNAIDSAVPTLLAGIGESAQNPNGADALFNLVNRQDDSVVNNMSSMIGSNQSSELIETGTRGLGSLMGNKGVTSMIGGLSGHTGLGKGSAGSLLGMLTPMIMGQLKQKSGSDGLNASGLASMLKGQGGNISAAMPAGMMKHLEASGFGDSDVSTGVAGNSYSTTTTTTTTTGGGYSTGQVAAGAAAATAGVAATAGAVGRSASNAASGAASTARGAVSNATQTASRNVSGAASTASNAAGNVGRSVTGAASGAAGAASSAASGAAGAARNAAGSVGNTVSGAASSATNAAGRGVDAVGNKVGGAVSNTRAAAGNATRTATSTAQTATNTTRTATTGTTGTRSTTSSTSYETPKKGGIWKWLLPIALAALAWFGFKKLGTPDIDVDVPNATGVVEGAKDAAAGAVDAVKDTAGDAVDATKDAASAVEMPKAEMPSIEMPEIPGLPEGMGAQLGDSIGGATSALQGITDVESAKAALPALDGLTGMLDKVPEAARGPVGGMLGNLTPLMDKASAIPGVGDVLGPVAEKLQGFM